ncbi:hypothetical protein Ddc_12853 [Ditylenchus destructor]|nr:hypothetical protein Ddc_12853 [Ditylenchus destructor]
MGSLIFVVLAALILHSSVLPGFCNVSKSDESEGMPGADSLENVSSDEIMKKLGTESDDKIENIKAPPPPTNPPPRNKKKRKRGKHNKWHRKGHRALRKAERKRMWEEHGKHHKKQMKREMRKRHKNRQTFEPTRSFSHKSHTRKNHGGKKFGGGMKGFSNENGFRNKFDSDERYR